MKKSQRILVKQDDPEITVRIPEDIYEALSAEAAKHQRSCNAELLMRLAATFENSELMAQDQLLRQIFGPKPKR